LDLPLDLFPASLFWLANAVMLLVLLVALWRAPLRWLRINAFTHVYFAACVVMLLLWNTRVGVLPALNFHLLGITAVTLMFGWSFAVFAVLLVTLGSTYYLDEHWLTVGLNSLVMGCIPVLLTEILLRVSQRRLPHNFFVYVYINGFLAAGLSLLAATLCAASLMWLVDPGSADWIAYQVIPYLPLVFFSEAIVTGMIMSVMVALRPQWVASFDDKLYINNK
jgi:uncharacterized membrane protein